jgi:hypothetical protein
MDDLTEDDDPLPMGWELFQKVVYEFITEIDDVEITLVVCETIFLVNIIINFFLQANDDSKTPLK